jgi:hypothetical protein
MEFSLSKGAPLSDEAEREKLPGALAETIIKVVAE